VKDGIQQVDEKSFRFVNEFFDEALKGSGKHRADFDLRSSVDYAAHRSISIGPAIDILSSYQLAILLVSWMLV
jgi:hypothetical protein